MTLERLNAHICLLEKKAKSEEILRSFEERIHPGVSSLSGTPHGTGISDKTGNLAAAIADMKDMIGELDGEITESAKEIEVFIKSIEDPRTRMIFRLRFLMGMQWKEVTSALGLYQTESNVKRICYDYMKKGQHDSKHDLSAHSRSTQ